MIDVQEMDKSTGGAAVDCGLLKLMQVPRVGGILRLQRVKPSSSCEGNGPSPFQAGMTTERLNTDQAQGIWANTSELDCAELGEPINLVSLHHNWQAYMDQPMMQQVSGTCALVSCTVCLLAVHRIEYENGHGYGGLRFQFPWRCMAAALRRLFVKCDTDGIWVSGLGANVGMVLNKIQEMGGLPAINVPTTLEERLLPLRKWEMHWWGDYHGHGLSPERVAELLDNNGPLVGQLWVIAPLYQCVEVEADDRDDDNTAVYTTRGCGRSDDIRLLSEDLFPDYQVGWHAVVCFDYRFRDGQMHVLVLDNHKETGPRRWIHVKELYALYSLTV